MFLTNQLNEKSWERDQAKIIEKVSNLTSYLNIDLSVLQNS